MSAPPEDADRTPRSVGLALGSGGARGWCHIGVIRALEAGGLRPAAIAGASMGALVGAVHAAGRLDRLEDWARGLTTASFARLLDPGLSGGGLVGAREVAATLRRFGLPARIEALEMPFAAVACDLETGERVVMDEGDLIDAVRASIALPGVISPSRVGGRWLLDGGLTDPVPVGVCRALGADAVIAVNPNARKDGRIWHPAQPETDRGLRDALLDMLPEGLRGLVGDHDPQPEPPSYLAVVAGSIDILTEQLRRYRLKEDPPDLALDARLDEMPVLAFADAGRAIAEGRRMVEAEARRIDALRRR